MCVSPLRQQNTAPNGQPTLVHVVLGLYALCPETLHGSLGRAFPQAKTEGGKGHFTEDSKDIHENGYAFGCDSLGVRQVDVQGDVHAEDHQ